MGQEEGAKLYSWSLNHQGFVQHRGLRFTHHHPNKKY